MNAVTYRERQALAATAPITELAHRNGIEAVCKNVGLYTAWLEMADEREPWGNNGAISTQELLTDFLLNDRASDEQIALAVREMRRRFVADNQAEIAAEASRAMEQ